MKFITRFFKPKLSREAFEAYFHRLPSVIEVSWFRDGRYIVGNIKTSSEEFMTQGLDAEDFIGMVNDAIYTMFDIPEDYIDVIKTFRTYRPSLNEKQKLENISVTGSVIKFVKDEKVLETA